ncbi:MAG: hypothetical protein U5M23_01345 [Marinagarivorans sp.]|nr:hypothetical protein [Marinagarivorans sp.]
MALNPITAFPGRVAAADSEYPHGRARNITTPGDGTSTPFVADLVNDIFGMQQALLNAAGLTPSGVPDTAIASQYVDAIRAIGSGALTFATDAAMVARTPVGAAAFASWAQYVGKTVITLRNNAAWPPAQALYNLQIFVILSGTANPADDGVIDYNLGGGFYAKRAQIGSSILIDWFADMTSAQAIAATETFTTAGFSPVAHAPRLITVTSTASTYSVPYWTDGLTVTLSPTSAATITVPAGLAMNRPVTFVIGNENATLILPGAGKFKGRGAKVTVLGISTTGDWVLQSATPYIKTGVFIGSGLALEGTIGTPQSVGPTGSGADVIWSALDGLENASGFYIEIACDGLASTNTHVGAATVVAGVSSTDEASFIYQAGFKAYNPASGSFATGRDTRNVYLPNTSGNGIFYAEKYTSEAFTGANGSHTVSLWLTGYQF